MTQAAEFATADLADEHGTALQFCQAPLHQYGGRRAFCGPLATIRCFQDNALLKASLAEPGHGRVMVVDGGGSLSYALLGDMLGDSAVRNGWAGVVVNGAVRDTAVLRTLDLGVKALGAFPRRSAKTGAGERDVVVEFGSVVFTPGDRLFSDDDGIVLLPAAG